MRVIIYAPESPGRARTVRAVQRDVEAQGHEVFGVTSVAAEAKVAYKSGLVDQIAGRPEHLIDLAAGWAMPVSPRASSTALAAVAAPVAWLGERSKSHPAAAASVGATAVLGGALIALLTLTPEPRERPNADPPRAHPSWSAPASPPPPATPSPRSPSEPAEPPPERPREAPPSASENGGRSGGSGSHSVPASPSPPPAETGSPVPPPPTATEPPVSPTPPAGNGQPDRNCLLDVEAPGLDIRLCLG